MKKVITLLLLIIVFGTSISYSQSAAPTVEEYGEIIEKMMKQIKTLKTLQYDFTKNERYEGEIVKSEQFAKHLKPASRYEDNSLATQHMFRSTNTFRHYGYNLI